MLFADSRVVDLELNICEIRDTLITTNIPNPDPFTSPRASQSPRLKLDSPTSQTPGFKGDLYYGSGCDSATSPAHATPTSSNILAKKPNKLVRYNPNNKNSKSNSLEIASSMQVRFVKGSDGIIQEDHLGVSKGQQAMIQKSAISIGGDQIYGTFNSVAPPLSYQRAPTQKTNYTAAAPQHLRPAANQEFFLLILLSHKLNNQGIKVIMEMDGRNLFREATEE